MDSELVEDLFSQVILRAKHARKKFLAESVYPPDVKASVGRLLVAYETKSLLLNEDLLADIEVVSPNFFDELALSFDTPMAAGTRVKQFVIDSLVGAGGMSLVYKAQQLSPMKRTVALKFIRPSILAPTTQARFLQEQQTLALVNHKNIATLYHVDTAEDGQPFSTMEFVDGMPIDEFCKNIGGNSFQRLDLFLQACDGVIHAHKNQITHRDIKPENILVCTMDDEHVVKLVDFGIAKLSDDHASRNQKLTQFGQILGSPRYMSPEQLLGRSACPLSDQYSLALVLFELLSRSPYRNGNSTVEIIRESNQEPRRLSETIRNNQTLTNTLSMEVDQELLINSDLDRVLATALSQNPNDRYGSVSEFVVDLRNIIQGRPVTIARPSLFSRASRLANTNRTPIILAMMFGIAILGSYTVYSIQGSKTDLTKTQQAYLVSHNQASAANDLVVQLLASNTNELTFEHFDHDLLEIYQQQYDRIVSAGGPKSKEDCAIYGILAVLHAMTGNFNQSYGLMQQVENQNLFSEIQLIRNKICTRYARIAKSRLLELDGLENASERACQQLILARCYLLSNMFDEAEKLLKTAIPTFDNSQIGFYHSLDARITLAQVLKNKGNFVSMIELLQNTHQTFSEQAQLDRRGRTALKKINQLLVLARELQSLDGESK